MSDGFRSRSRPAGLVFVTAMIHSGRHASLDRSKAANFPAVGYGQPTPDKPIRLGRYEILERIGSGGMAEVFKARLVGPEGFSRIVVIKRLSPRLLDDAVFRKMFISEAKIAAAADHDQIARVYELDQTPEGHFFIVMEWVDGIDLERLLSDAAKRGLRVPVWFTLHIVCEILEALSYVHGLVDETGRPRNVVHRDATPSNIFVSRLGQVKLLDFGIAAYEGKTPTTQAGQLKGKLGYMSPEQLRGQPLDHRSDLFSMGVVLWEALTQERLFGQLSEMQAMLAIASPSRLPPSEMAPGLDPELDRVVLKALATERDSRYQSADELQEELFRILHRLRSPIRPAEVRHVVEILEGKRSSSREPQLRKYGRETIEERPDSSPPEEESNPTIDVPPFLAEPPLPVAIPPPLPIERTDSKTKLDEESPFVPSKARNHSLEETAADIVETLNALKHSELTETVSEPNSKESYAELLQIQASMRTGLKEPKAIDIQTGDLEESGATTTMEEPLSLDSARQEVRSTTREVASERSQMHFYVQREGGNSINVLSYEPAMEQARKAAYEGIRTSVSADGQRWIDLDELSRLTWQDFWADVEIPTNNVTIVGSLGRESLASLFARLSVETATGQLTVFRTKSVEESWYEIHVVEGRPTKVVTDIPSMQLPAIMIEMGLADRPTITQLLHNTLQSRRAVDEVARSMNLTLLSKEAYMKARLIEMFRWRHADFTFNANFTNTTAKDAFARTLTALLPSSVFRAHDVSSLLSALGPRVGQTLVPTPRFDVHLDGMDLPPAHRRFAERFREPRSPEQWIKTFPDIQKQVLTYVYILLEIGSVAAQ